MLRDRGERPLTLRREPDGGPVLPASRRATHAIPSESKWRGPETHSAEHSPVSSSAKTMVPSPPPWGLDSEWDTRRQAHQREPRRQKFPLSQRCETDRLDVGSISRVQMR
jgi:hypothetical protein